MRLKVPFPAARQRITRILHHPLVPLSVGVTMVATSAAEVIEPFLAGEPPELATAHGLILFGITIALRALLELLEGLEKVGASAAALSHPGDGKGPHAAKPGDPETH